MLKKLLTTTAAVLFLCTAVNAQKDGEWRKFKPAGESVTASFLCTPESSTENFSDAGIKIVQSMHACVYDSTYYALTVATLSTDPVDARAYLDKYKEGIVKGFGGEVLSEKAITAAGKAGIELSIKKDDAMMFARVFSVGPQIVGIMYGRPSAVSALPSDSTFISSLAFGK